MSWLNLNAKNTFVFWQCDFYRIVVVFDFGRLICGFFMDFHGICVGFLWNYCGIVMVFASGWPKSTEQIVELPWLQSK